MERILETALPYLDRHPADRPVIDLVRRRFSITSAQEKPFRNYVASSYHIRPNQETFKELGIAEQILLIIVPERYPELFGALGSLIEERIRSGEVTDDIVLIVSSDTTGSERISTFRWSTFTPLTVFVHISRKELADNILNHDYIYQKLRKELFRRNFFEYWQPIRIRQALFGRDSTLTRLNNLIDSGQPFGLFGLRRSGKTSILINLADTFKNEDKLVFNLIRCEETSSTDSLYTLFLRTKILETLRLLHIDTNDELYRLIDKNLKSAQYKAWTLDEDWRYIRLALGDLLSGQEKTIVWMFDEVESISGAYQGSSWTKGMYYHLFQKLASIVEESDKLMLIISGTNPALLETATWSDEQTGWSNPNPLAGRYEVVYCGTLAELDFKKMMLSLGTPSGLSFDDDAVVELYNYFWGMPFPARKFLASLINDGAIGSERPFRITRSFINGAIAKRRSSQVFEYFKVMIDNLALLYPMEQWYLQQLSESEEYASLIAVELLEPKNVVTRRHLESYGVIRIEGEKALVMPALRDALTTYHTDVTPKIPRFAEVGAPKSLDTEAIRGYVRDKCDRTEVALNVLLVKLGPMAWSSLQELKEIVKKKIDPRADPARKRSGELDLAKDYSSAIGLLTLSEKIDLVLDRTFWSNYARKIIDLDRGECAAALGVIRDLRDAASHPGSTKIAFAAEHQQKCDEAVRKILPPLERFFSQGA